MTWQRAHAVPTCLTATAADAVVIIRDMCLRSGAGFPDALVVDQGAKLTSVERGVSRLREASSRALARASSSARPTTRIPTPRWTSWWSGPTAPSATLRQRTQGRLEQSSHASRIRHQLDRNDARRWLDAFLHRPRLTPPSRRLTTTSPPESRRRTKRSGCARWRPKNARRRRHW